MNVMIYRDHKNISQSLAVRLKVVTMLLTAVFLSITPLFNGKVSALSGSDFNAGYIISDAQFFDGYSLSDAAIQTWLNAQVPSCDTNGTQPATDKGRSDLTHAQYAAARGWQAPPYTCLKNYSLTHGAVSADQYCAAIPAATETAASILMNVGRACGVSPKILLVLLQKEQNIVTDTWPDNTQYTKATGYFCPDTPLNSSVDSNQNGCYDAYEGFFNQVYYGARQFQLYKTNPSSYNFRAGRTQNILYNPNGSCGSSPVFIQNQATAGLYNYTPYQPNAAALANLNGTGDGCSAYGNRNFWRMFSNWWGNSTLGCQNSPLNTQVLRLYDPKTFNHFYTLDYCEANSLRTSYGYSLEGPVFNTVSNVPDATPIYRMYNSKIGLHHYVTSQADIDGATLAGYHLEGIAFYVAPPTYPGAFPVYRLYNPKTFIHLWVTSQADINGAIPAGYHYEGIAWYAS